jgi:hypothetical protein
LSCLSDWLPFTCRNEYLAVLARQIVADLQGIEWVILRDHGGGKAFWMGAFLSFAVPSIWHAEGWPNRESYGGVCRTDIRSQVFERERPYVAYSVNVRAARLRRRSKTICDRCATGPDGVPHGVVVHAAGACSRFADRWTSQNPDAGGTRLDSFDRRTGRPGAYSTAAAIASSIDSASPPTPRLTLPFWNDTHGNVTAC